MTRTILITLIALAACGTLAAQEVEEPSLAATTFLIERIEVRNAKRVSPDVIVAESRLREGVSYSEEELSDASNRLARLPFLLAAEFSLERGSERGKHVLVITVTETKPFFYALDARPIYEQDARARADYSDRIGTGNSEATLGVRWFVGRRGALHAGLFASDLDHDYVDDYSSFAVGYTQYDLFGTRAFATFNAKLVFGSFSGSSRTAISPELVVGVPLSPNQTLTVQLTNTRLGDSERTIRTPIVVGVPPFQFDETTVDINDSQRLISSTWSYNTTNRPFLPTRGTVVSVTPLVSWNDSASYTYEANPDSPTRLRVVALTQHSRTGSVKVNASRYWEISDRNAVSGGMEASYARLDSRSSFLGDSRATAWRGIATFGVSRSLWDPSRDRYGDSRIEANLRLGAEESSVEDDVYRYGADYDRGLRQIGASWVRRSSWGTLRLGAGFAW